jgi:hypothetical protein
VKIKKKQNAEKFYFASINQRENEAKKKAKRNDFKSVNNFQTETFLLPLRYLICDDDEGLKKKKLIFHM